MLSHPKHRSPSSFTGHPDTPALAMKSTYPGNFLSAPINRPRVVVSASFRRYQKQHSHAITPTPVAQSNGNKVKKKVPVPASVPMSVLASVPDGENHPTLVVLTAPSRSMPMTVPTIHPSRNRWRGEGAAGKVPRSVLFHGSDGRQNTRHGGMSSPR